MFNQGKTLSGIAAVGIYLLLLFVILYYYNVHNQKAKNYVEKNSNRVTVTLVNSDKTVLNRSDKINNTNKPTVNPVKTPKVSTPPPIPKKTEVKQLDPKKEDTQREQQRLASAQQEQKKKEQQARQENERKKALEAQNAVEAKKALEAKKIAEAKKALEAKKVAEQKKEQERQRLAQLEAKKKQAEEAKKKEAERLKEQERQRLAALEAKKKKETKERQRQAEESKKRQSAQDLFANVNAKEPVKQPVKQPAQSNPQPSQVKHTTSATDRIQNTHQSGQVSDQNRERGVENAYIAKVKRQLNNWSAQSNYEGHQASIRLTINSSGHFSYSIQSSTNGDMSAGLREFLDQLNRMGLGSHTKSTPYVINVNFIAR